MVDNSKIRQGLSVDELKQDYTEYKKMINTLRLYNLLSEDLRKWSYEWELLDLHTSPMEDKDRKLIRYGHYTGYFTDIDRAKLIAA